MWKDSIEARRERYLGYLRKNPELYRPLARTGERERENDSTGFLKGEQKAIFELVCDYVLAPALDSYVLWVLREAIVAGKKRLYFLARDGYMFYQAAQIYCQRFQLPLECRYLCCSRYSLRIPMFHLNMEDAMDYICRGGIAVTMKKILNRAGLTAEEQEQVLSGIKMAAKQEDIIPYAKLAEIRKRLEQSELFQQLVLQHSKEAFPVTAEYLRQEGLLDDIPFAIADSGWVGSMQKVLNQLLSHIRGASKGTKNRLEGYYWGLYELPEGVSALDYHCFYFSPNNNLKEKVYFSNCLFEGVFSAPHGMTLGYCWVDGGCRPVYDTVLRFRQQFTEETGSRILRYVRRRADAIPRTEGNNSLKKYLSGMSEDRNRRTIYELLKAFMGEPIRQEVELFGMLEFSDDVLEEGGQQIAAPLSQQELRDNHAVFKVLTMLGVKKGPVKESAWYEGSAVRGGRNVEKHLRGYAGYKYLLYLRKKRMWSKRKDE